MPDQVTLTIDGVEVKTRPGTMVLQAAIDHGLYIPYLCYYPGMKPWGACRMCVVEIEGGRGTPASCTTPVTEGMVVRTNTPNLVGLRKGILEMLIAEHPHGCLNCHRIELCGPGDICLRHRSVNDRCVMCPKNERCELKDTVRFLEMKLESPFPYNYRNLPIKVDDPFWDMDLNLCIVCARCVRVCDEVRGDYALSLNERSGRGIIGTAHGTSLLESGCEFCGACIDVCPTGTLVERQYKWEKAARTVNTICPHCPVGCEMKLEVNRRNRVIRPTPNIHSPANRGQFCFKGKFGLDFVNRKEQLKRPLVRRNGALEEVSWLEALDFTAQQLALYRGSQFALLVSPRATNEESYLAQKFARAVMGSNSVDVSSNVRPELVQPLGEMLGYQAGTNSIWELERSRCFLVVSSNITEEQNVAAVPIKMATRRGASLIVIDERETELTRYATVWLRPRPGTTTAVIGGMLRVIFDESLDDHDFLSERCEGVDALRNSLWNFDLVKVERMTGVQQTQVQAAARLFARNKPAAVLYALETVPPERRAECVRALVDLALATGNVGKPSGGLYPLYLGANEQGARDVGCTPEYLPGYKPVSDEKGRNALKRTWNADVPATPGLSLRQLTAAINEGRVKALQVMGNSPHFSSGELGDFLGALAKLDFLVVQDTFASELTEHAHVVLPSATFAQKDGTYTNMERRLQFLRPAVLPRAEEEPDWKTLCQIARRMGASGFDYETTEDIFAELSSVVDIYGGISYERMRARTVQWPCLAADMDDTPILYASGFPSGKARLAEVKLGETQPRQDRSYPLVLARGRVLHQPERQVTLEKLDGRNVIRRDEVVEVHPEDARALGVADGDWVEVVSASQRFRARVSLTGPNRGMVSVTGLFGQLATELDRSTDVDPMLKVPGLPLVPVRLEKAPVPAAAD